MEKKFQNVIFKARPYLILSVEDYRKKYEEVLKKQGEHTLKYFDRRTQKRVGIECCMLKFPDGEWVPGGSWPDDYALVHIENFSRMLEVKGRRKIKIKGGYDYVDWKGMNDLVPMSLKTTRQNILAEVKRKRYSLYNVPHRFFNKYKDKLTIMIGGTRCGPTDIPKKLLVKILAAMTPYERSEYEQSLYAIDVNLYPSIEQPVLVRIDGIDDGAEEALFPDVKSAWEAIKDIAIFHTNTKRRDHGFRGTD